MAKTTDIQIFSIDFVGISLKTFTEFKKGITFAPTEPVLYTIRTANGSFFKDSTFTNDNTPPMPLHDAHLGGFLFL